jgi:hypothetical protein
MSDNTEGAIKNVCLQFRETGIIGYTRPWKTKQKHNTICVGHHYLYMQTNTSNVNKTWTFLITIVGKDEPSIVFMRALNVKTHNRTIQKSRTMSNTRTVPIRKTGGELRCSRRVSSSSYATHKASAICKVCTLYESYYGTQIILDALGACLQ